MAATAPFDLLLDISARVRSDGAEARLRIQPHWTGVDFSVLGQRLVAPMGSVTEILMVPPLTRLPRVQPWVRGVANVRGRLLPVIGLAAFLGGRATLNWREHRVLVLGDAGQLERLGNRRDRADAHDFGRHTGHGKAAEARQRHQVELLKYLFRNEQDRRRTV